MSPLSASIVGEAAVLTEVVEEVPAAAMVGTVDRAQEAVVATSAARAEARAAVGWWAALEGLGEEVGH